MADSIPTKELDEVLKSAARSIAEESIVLTGVVLQAESPDRFTLQHNATSRSVYSVFRKADVIGSLCEVPHSLRTISDLGRVIHAVRLKKGAPGILFQEGTHTVGNQPHTPAVLKEYTCAGVISAAPTQVSSLEEILKSAHKPEQAYGVFPGVIHPGTEPDEIILQVNPPRNLDYAIIKRADIVETGSITELPQNSLPLSKRGHHIHLVRVREGATIRAVTGMQARVERQPTVESGCSCSETPEKIANPTKELRGYAAECEGPQVDHVQRPVLAGGRRCRTTVCLNAKGKWDYCCANEWDPCDYQWATGVCTTAEHWLWGMRCFCASTWAPL